jgi:hypothetical protein
MARQLDDRHVLRLANYEPDRMSDVEHVLFSLKHDGISLPILSELFATLDRKQIEKAITAAVRETPTGQYHRRLWYLYEWLTDRELPLAATPATNYEPLLDPEAYMTGRGTKHARHRIIDNLPGNRHFCPMVRRTPELAARSAETLVARVDELLAGYDKELLDRALAYLYTKETRSSFAIERETPNPKRAERFANALRRVGTLGELSERTLTELQNLIVEPRYMETGYRETQNYVGETINLHRQRIHYVAPKPEDVPALMDGYLRAVTEHTHHTADGVAWAAAVAFGFVFVHPFEDGNGRLHRFLIHYMLATQQLTRPGIIIPVSAVMLARRAEYDDCLEVFSNPLMELVDYELDDRGRMVVTNDTARYYRYFDATPMAEALYRWLDVAIDHDLKDELRFLLGLREARAAMQDIVDLPDRRADLFVKLVLANHGRLAKRKRAEFAELTDDEISALEQAVRSHMLSSEG